MRTEWINKRKEKEKKGKEKKKSPNVGIEPTTIGLKGQRSTVWASWAFFQLSLLTSWKNKRRKKKRKTKRKVNKLKHRKKKVNRKREMAEVGFEPTPPKRPGP